MCGIFGKGLLDQTTPIPPGGSELITTLMVILAGLRMSQTSQPARSSWRSRRSLIIMGTSAVLLIAILGVGFITSTNVTQHQILTTTQNLNVIQTVTTNSIVTVLTQITTTLSSGLGSGCGYYGCSYSNPESLQNCGSNSCAYPNCGPNGCSFQICGANGCSSVSAGYAQLCGSTNCSPEICGFNGCYYTTCLSLGQNLLQCSGYLYQDTKGCTELKVPVANYVNGYMATTATQYYTLHNLPLSTPPMGTWVTVTGQFSQGHNTASNGASCPGNYVNVTSVTQ